MLVSRSFGLYVYTMQHTGIIKEHIYHNLSGNLKHRSLRILTKLAFDKFKTTNKLQCIPEVHDEILKLILI